LFPTSKNIPPLVSAAKKTFNAHGRRKGTKREQLDEHFSSASKDLLIAWQRKIINEWYITNVFLIEIRKMQTQVDTKLQMHEKELAVRERIKNQVTKAFSTLAKSFAHFIREIAKKSYNFGHYNRLYRDKYK
jgi:hypothetical protein